MSENSYVGSQTSAPVRRFLRSRDDRMIAGVCGGAARYFGIDPTLLRLLLVVAAILGIGTGALVYLACWLLVPEEA
jgi:phage shock protein C